jgi:signal transduction histidine kinase
MDYSIRNKMIIGFFSIVLFFSIIAVYLLNQSGRSLQDSIGNSTVLIAESKLLGIISSIHNISFVIKSNSNWESIKDLIEKSNNRFSLIKNIPVYMEKIENKLQSGDPKTVSLINKTARNHIAHHFNNDIIEYYESNHGYRVINDILITNRYGATIAATGNIVDYDQSDDEWWVENIGKDYTVTGYKLDSHSGQPGINVIVRIKDEKGRFIGMLKSFVDISGIIRETDLSIKRYRNTYTSLLSESGHLIYSTLTFVPNEDYKKKEIYRLFTADKGFFTINDGPEKKLISYVKSRNNEHGIGSGWTIFVSHDLDEVLEPVLILKKQFTILLFLFLVTGTAIALWNTRAITKPLSALVKDIDIISMGNLDHKVEIESKNEFSYLGERFNNMLINLKNTVEALKTSNKDLEQFAYVASHDLQEPLRMVSSYLELIKKRYADRLDDDADEFIEYAIDGAKRMKILINDLLSFSRIATRGKDFILNDLNELFVAALNNLKLTIEENNAEITCNDLPEIHVDDTQFIQLIQNLLSNALKFRGEEDPVVQISAREKENEWEFSVKDNGIGIDTQFTGKIFVIFQRLHTRNEYSGTGIGLAICKKIVERHRGRIWFDSVIGEGTTFTFTINKYLYLFNNQGEKIG